VCIITFNSIIRLATSPVGLGDLPVYDPASRTFPGETLGTTGQNLGQMANFYPKSPVKSRENCGKILYFSQYFPIFFSKWAKKNGKYWEKYKNFP